MNGAEGPKNAKIHKRMNKKMASQKDEKEEVQHMRQDSHE
jgi:hypothetical protein